MGWNRLALVSSADIGNLEPEATSSDRPWGHAHWPKQCSEAKRDLKIWIETDFADLPGACDRIIDRWNPDWAFKYTSAAYADISSEIRNDTEEDVNLAAALATPSTDRIYLGAPFEFDGLFVKLLDSVNANASVLTVKYWALNQWQTIQCIDGTALSGKAFAQSGRVTWTTPTDWERRTLNGTGDEYYWVEISVSAALTAGTAVSQMLAIRSPDALKRIATYLALYHILNGLAQAAAEPANWQTKAQAYWDKAVALYSAVKNNKALWMDLDKSGGLTAPEETTLGKSGVTLGRA